MAKIGNKTLSLITLFVVASTCSSVGEASYALLGDNGIREFEKHGDIKNHYSTENSARPSAGNHASGEYALEEMEQEVNVLLQVLKHGFNEEKSWLRQQTNMLNERLEQANRDMLLNISGITSQLNFTRESVAKINHSINSIHSSVKEVQKQFETLVTNVTSLNEHILDVNKQNTAHSQSIADQQILIKLLYEKMNQNWTFYGKSLYFRGNEKLTWQQANTKCVELGGYLAEVTSSEEQFFLVGLAQSYLSSAKGIWLGGTDAHLEGNWIWVHSQQPVESYITHWDDGEPNSYWKTNEDCLELRKLVKYLWNDSPCTSKNAFICEKDIE